AGPALVPRRTDVRAEPRRKDSGRPRRGVHVRRGLARRPPRARRLARRCGARRRGPDARGGSAAAPSGVALVSTETGLVTGARGTVGGYVVGLAEAAGYRVIANDATAQGLAVPVRGEVRAGDLRDASVRARALAGVDHVVHTAALLDAGAEAAELAKTN